VEDCFPFLFRLFLTAKKMLVMSVLKDFIVIICVLDVRVVNNVVGFYEQTFLQALNLPSITFYGFHLRHPSDTYYPLFNLATSEKPTI
jgi:hypothetical protein